jgi:CBS domain-containing protein
VDSEGGLLGVVSQRDLLDPKEPAAKRVGDLIRGPFVATFEDNSLRQASDLMAQEGLGRLPVVERDNPRKLVAILSGSDIRSAIRNWLEESDQPKQTFHRPS